MKHIPALFLTGVILAGSVAPARADEAGKRSKIEQLLRLTHYDESMKQTLEQVKSMQAAQISQTLPPAARDSTAEVQSKIMAVIANRFSFEKVKPLMISMYAEIFDEAEIDGIVAFYQSPAGKAFLEKMPQMMQRMMPMIQQLMADVQPEIQKIVDDAKKQN